ncbi:response regulator transcription factor [Paenibacillus endoradicis]|uniref:response regulator transcription factor n=1 Tax=Paenibacillus endoradicis TaxID=2972487 RepID=UPI002158E145|nr:response regulator [Paenibacillus endoradicis]MCR8658567.1 response regulator [Paenibacillus endoradicis]
MRILVVDDEYFARKAIVQMIQDWNAEVQVDEADNGKEAMELFSIHPPDVVFSDIRMPLVDGIELSAYIKEHHPDTVNVIISGYDDFKYAQQAIQNKVEHYLLKPAGKEQLWPILEQCKEKEVTTSEKRIEESLAAALYEGMPLQFLSTLGGEQAVSFTIAVLRTDPSYKEKLNETAKGIWAQSNWREVTIGDRRHANTIVVMIWKSDEVTSSEWLKKLRHSYEHVIQTFFNGTQQSVSIGISGVYTKLDELTVAYKEAKSAVLYRLISGDNQLHILKDTRVHRSNDYNLIDDWIASLRQKIIRHQHVEAVDMLRHYVKNASVKELSVITLQDMCAKVTAMLNSLIDQFEVTDEHKLAYLEQIDLHEYESIEVIVDAFAVMISSIGELISSQNKGKMNIVDDIKNYVMHNYKQDIILEDLAKTVYFTDPTYLSRIFKKKTNMRFSQFLLSVRMNNAKSMLDSGSDLMISEIASAVGYNDYSYFIQTYKKFFGETPGKTKASR